MIRKSTFFWILAFLLAAGCEKKIEPGHQAPGPSVSVTATISQAKITGVPQAIETVGSVTAKTASMVSAKMMGTVTAVHAAEGQAVSGGQTLAQIDNRGVNAALRQARAALGEALRGETATVSARQAAGAGAELARITHARYAAMVGQESISRQEFDDCTARLRQAEAAEKQAMAMVEAAGQRIEQARGAMAAAQIAAQDATVTAPYNGRIVGKLVSVGDLATPGKPLFAMERPGGLEVVANLPESRIRDIRMGQEALVDVPAAQLSNLQAPITQIVLSGDPVTRSFRVKIDLAANDALRTGMFARVRIITRMAPTLTVPPSAVVRQGQLTGLYVVDDGSIARFRLIRTGRSIENRLEVISGLKEGQRFVVEPPVDMADGVRVEAAS